MNDFHPRVKAAIERCLERLINVTDPRAALCKYVELAELAGDLSRQEIKTVASVVFNVILDREQRIG